MRPLVMLLVPLLHLCPRYVILLPCSSKSRSAGGWVFSLSHVSAPGRVCVCVCVCRALSNPPMRMALLSCPLITQRWHSSASRKSCAPLWRKSTPRSVRTSSDRFAGILAPSCLTDGELYCCCLPLWCGFLLLWENSSHGLCVSFVFRVFLS